MNTGVRERRAQVRLSVGKWFVCDVRAPLPVTVGDCVSVRVSYPCPCVSVIGPEPEECMCVLVVFMVGPAVSV